MPRVCVCVCVRLQGVIFGTDNTAAEIVPKVLVDMVSRAGSVLGGVTQSGADKDVG